MLILNELDQKTKLLADYKAEYDRIAKIGDCDELEELETMIADMEQEIRLLKKEIKRIFK